VIRDVGDFLSSLFPFSSLPPFLIEKLAKSVEVRYYARGETLFKKGQEPPPYLFIVRKGSLLLKEGDREVDFLTEGDSLGQEFVLKGEKPKWDAVAQTDLILYLIPAEVLKELVERYEDFKNFFASSRAERISRVSRLVKPKETLGDFEKFLTLRVKDLKLKKPVFLKPKESVLTASRVMVKEGLGCVLVEGERGIITERDLIKKVVSQGKDPSAVKLKEVMSAPYITVDEEAFLFDAILLMAKHNIRRLVVEREGKAVGLLEDKDILALESKSFLVLFKEVEKARSVEELSYLYRLLREAVVNMTLSGVKAEHIGRLIAELNDKFIGRAVGFAIQELGLEPPVSYSLLVLGSEGRREQTLKTDQDNALLYDDTYPLLDADPESYFKAFGEKVSEVLLRIGFPPCPSGVMVRNPQWNAGITRWKERVKDWIEKPTPENLLKAGIFFDFRNAFGNSALEEELREFVLELTSKADLFIAYMLREALRFKPPIGLFGRLKKEIDLKKGGIFPITQGVRALALKYRVKKTGTLERLERLKEEGHLPEELALDLSEAFRFLQELRLKSQVEKLREGKEPDNLVHPEELPRLERDLLKDALRVVEEFQSFIEHRYLSYIPI